MGNLQKLGLKTKFATIFIMFSVLVMGVSFVAWKSMGQLSSSLQRAYFTNLPSINLLLQLDRDLHQAVIAQNQIMDLKAGDPAINELMENYTENLGQVKERWGKYKNLITTDEERNLVSGFESDLSSWKAQSSQMLTSHTEGLDSAGSSENKTLYLKESFDKAREYINKLTELVEKDVEQQEENNNEMYSGSLRLFTIVLLISLVLTVLAWRYFYSAIVKPVLRLNDAAQQVASGNTGVEVSVLNKDEIGSLAASFNKMIKDIGVLLNDAGSKAEAANEAARKAEAAEVSARAQKEYLSENINRLLNCMNDFANGDLTVKISAEKDDEIAKLFGGFNRSVEKIAGTIRQVDEAIHATASAASEISASSEQIAAGATSQTQQVTEIAGAAEEMTRTILETTGSINEASELSRTASQKAELGYKRIEETKHGITKIVESSSETAMVIASLSGKSDQIGEITQVIEDIADQTNLLALNAAIEAARAGEQGRGFAVVADEVRKLAERTTKATKEIADTIKAIQLEAKKADSSMENSRSAVEEGMRRTEEVAMVLKDILGASQRVSDVITQVAASSEEQSATAEEISRNIEGISGVIQQSATGTEETARAAEDLTRLTLGLQTMIGSFRVDNGIKAKGSVAAGSSALIR